MAHWNLHLLHLLCLVFPTKEMRTDYAIKIPYVMGIIATRSTDKEVTGLHDLMKEHEIRIRNGMVAYSEQPNSVRAISPRVTCIIWKNQKDLGYGLLLKKYTPNVVVATEEHIKAATKDTIQMSLHCSFRSVRWWLWCINVITFPTGCVVSR